MSRIREKVFVWQKFKNSLPTFTCEETLFETIILGCRFLTTVAVKVNGGEVKKRN